MNFSILCVGKIKENFYKKSIEYYVERINTISKVAIIEVADEQTPDNASDKEVNLIKQKEGEALLSHVTSNMYLIALDMRGKMMNSTSLKNHIKQLSESNNNDIAFVIGGSLGLSTQLIKRANLKLSFSKMTFPHQLMRVILLEQIYNILI
ncbi:MAG: 23S rRNA (pseudouridine(1915)-N(3))-methyltransferase RlmH [Bacillota bacterium]|nr:23S rRNA (pseudouridine(1915)-N(3))-methyltransferase RlmH [Bacillota bacterium]